MRKLWLALLCALTACTGITLPEKPLVKVAEPSDLVHGQETLVTDHKLMIERYAEKHTLLLHTEINADSISMVGFGPLGEALFECNAQIGELNCNKIAEAIPAEKLLTDIQLALMPLAALQKKMAGGFTIDEEGNTRRVNYKNQPWSEITYNGVDIWSAEIEIKNNLYNYSLQLKPLNVNRGNHA